jgi:hypothetical protein
MIKKYRVVKLLLISCLIMNISSYSIMAQDIVINGGVVNHVVYGNGALPDGNAPTAKDPSNNSVTIQGGAVVNGTAVGGTDESGCHNVVNNRLNISSGTIVGYAFAGSSYLQKVEGNILEIRGGTIKGEASGGHGHMDAMIKNRLNISGGAIVGNAFGGRSWNKGKVQENILEMTGGTIAGDVYGGYSSSGDAIKNRLSISSGTIVGEAYGGRANTEIAEGNILEMKGGTINKDAYGGYGDSGAMSNRLNILGGTIVGEAYGGKSNKRIAQGNILEMKGGRIFKDAYGGYGEANAINNRLTITNGDIVGEAYGGRANTEIAEGNILEMTGGTISNNAFGGYGEANAINNRLTITNGDIVGGAYGGKSNKGVALENKLEMTGGTIIKDAYGGYGDGTAINNILNISRGTIKGNVIGGRGKLDANNNKVIINGGEFWANVYGGISENGVAIFNSIEIRRDPKFSSNTVIYGGYSTRDGAEVFTGNTLNLETEGPVVLKGIKNFESYNFGKVIVNAPAVLKVATDVNLTRSKVVGKVEGEVKEGDRVNLIEAEDGVTEAKSIEMYKGSGLVKLIHERVGNEKELSLKIKGQEVTLQAQKINEVGATGMILVGQGLGFLSERGIEEAVGSVKGKRGRGVEVFVGVGGESSKYKSGMEMNIEGIRAVGGVAKSMEEGKVVVGGYVEHGKGNYKVEEVEGKGMTSYVGVGGLGRVMVGEEVYIDMSMGVGRQGIEFDGNRLNVLTKENIGYEYRSMYVGGHIGCGYKREVGEKVNIEMVGKVLMVRQEGKEVKLTNGVPVEIEGATSGKIKGLAKANYKCKEKVVPYVGVGYEYEFLGKSKGKVEGVELKEIDLKGGSGIGEIGVSSVMGDINIKLSGRGYIGVREGVEGMLKVGYSI